jgi:hypothetical protein
VVSAVAGVIGTWYARRMYKKRHEGPGRAEEQSQMLGNGGHGMTSQPVSISFHNNNVVGQYHTDRRHEQWLG